ncbi:MAG: hypothetical protein IOC90_05365 [Methylocystis sp.]|nr:hypothetical protein [Methylocystis sp.]MCA3587447.1 hypothetical protein [Methylocystis sp.]MCA3591062.1 hypothetical protein [Methylocystis sp.]
MIDLLDKVVVRTARTLFLSAGLLVPLAFAAPAHADDVGLQSVQVTLCAHVPQSVANASARRRAESKDCDPALARSDAFLAADAAAVNAVAAACRGAITRAEARAVCRAAGLTVPTTAQTDLLRPPRPRPGGPALEKSLPIANGGGPRLCAVLDHLVNETDVDKTANFVCLFNGGQETTVTARSRAYCGVQCF